MTVEGADCATVIWARGRIRGPSPDTPPPPSGLLRAVTPRLAAVVGGGHGRQAQAALLGGAQPADCSTSWTALRTELTCGISVRCSRTFRETCSIAGALRY